MKLRRIDTKWFQDQIKASRFGSQRQFAPHIKGRESKGTDPGTLTRMLTGKQEMLPSELVQIADLLRLPLAEVLRRYGFPLTGSSRRSRPRT